MCLRFAVSRHAECLFFRLHFDVILILISEKVALISFDASIYLASLDGRKWIECFIGVGPRRLCLPVQRIHVWASLPSVFVLYSGFAQRGGSACHQGCERLFRDKAYRTVSYAQHAHLEKTRQQRFLTLSTATDHFFKHLMRHAYLYLKIRRRSYQIVIRWASCKLRYSRVSVWRSLLCLRENMPPWWSLYFS